MRMTRRLAIGIAVVCGALTALLTYVWLSGLQQQTQLKETVKTAQVITPLQGIEPGVLVQASMLVTREVAEEDAPAGAAKSISELSGKLSIVALPQGEPIRLAQVQSLVGAGLSYVVPEGMRAVTVALDPVIGVAGYPKPGDRVDVIATFVHQELTVTRTVLQNVQLLALGKSAVIAQKEAKPSEDKAEGAVKAEPEAPPNATLAVTLKQAQRLILADVRGELRLALRPKFEEQYIAVQPTTSIEVIGEEFEKLRVAEAEALTTPPGMPPSPTVGPAAEITPPAALTREPQLPTVEVIRGNVRETVVIGGPTSSAPKGGVQQ